MQCPQEGPMIKNLKLRQYQKDVIKYFLKSKHKGMIFYHGLGAGKTITSLSFAIDYINQYPKYKILIITPGSLRFNFIREYCNHIGQPKYYDKFQFISYNYTRLAKNLEDVDFDNSVIIIDEFHNVINGARNMSTNYVKLYHKLFYAKNSKIILLSGTPLIYYPYELSLMYNLVKEDVFPLDVEKFSKLCKIQDGKLVIPNRKQFKQNLTGVLSYIKNLGAEFYPNVINMPDTYVTITKHQLPYYVRQRIKEIKIGIPDKKLASSVNIISKSAMAGHQKMHPAIYLAFSMLLSRQVANFSYPKKIQDQLLSTKKKTRAKAPPDHSIDLNFKKLKTEYSPKFYILIKRIKKLEGKHLVYTQYLNRYGVKLLRHIMDERNITSLSYTGNLGNDQERNFVLDSFNASDNLNGEKIKVLLTTSAGTQGLTLTETNYVHILEPHRSEMFIQQLIGRAVRFKSHERIKKKRSFVKIFRYYNKLPKNVSMEYKGNVLKDKESADVMIQKKSEIKHKAILPLLDIMKETAIDCQENYKKNCFKK